MANTRHTVDGGWWEIEQAMPHARLRAAVVGPYVQWREQTALPTTRRELAATIVPLIVNFDAPYRLTSLAHADISCHSFTAGVYDTWVDVHGATSSYAVQANLTPLAARAVLGVPLDVVTNVAAPVDVLLGAPGRELVEALGNAPDFAARVQLLDAFLLTRLQALPAAPAAVQWCWSRLAASHGQVAIATLQRETGWSAHRLGQALREHAGLTPRRLGTVLRFEQTLRDARAAQRAGARVSWSRLAAARGYADQAHLTRDFARFAGTTPTRWAAQQAGLPDVGAD